MYKGKKVFALITARGGSVRLPGKNVKDFFGKPLIAHSIIQGLACVLIDEVWVSSEDKQILGVSKLFGAKTLKRPNRLATTYATSEDVVKHFYESLREKPDFIVLLQPTSPLRKVETITGAITNFINESHKFSSLIPLKVEQHKSGNIIGKFYIPINHKEHFFECGTIFVYKANMMREENIQGVDIMPFIISEKEAIDIDTIEDFKKAEETLNADKNRR